MSEQQSQLNISRNNDRKDLSDTENPFEGLFKRNRNRQILVWVSIVALIVIIVLIVIQMASGVDLFSAIVN